MMIKQTIKETDILISAIISLYLKLVKYNVISKRDINILYEIFQSTFQEKITIQHIQKAIQNPYFLKQSANIINKRLSYPDKIKLLINLLLIAHINKDFSVLARLDILEVAEILQIDVRLYSRIIDVIEGKNRFLDIDLKQFTGNINQSIFQNFLIFGGCEDCDIQFGDKIGDPDKKLHVYNLIIL
ncbi:MAG: hypothetical protein U9N34_05665, partial [Candidatus Cloacimonadota bacterium]|nr:hypothetical protein [Candidatus Cloacimonadota bacterium]